MTDTTSETDNLFDKLSDQFPEKSSYTIFDTRHSTTDFTCDFIIHQTDKTDIAVFYIPDNRVSPEVSKRCRSKALSLQCHGLVISPGTFVGRPGNVDMEVTPSGYAVIYISSNTGYTQTVYNLIQALCQYDNLLQRRKK